MSGDFPVVALGSLAADTGGSVAIGPSGSAMKSDLYVSDGVPVIRGSNISTARELVGDWVFIPDEFANSMPRCIVTDGDLVFPHRGSIGEIALVPSDSQRYFLSTSCMKITLDRRRAEPAFVYYFFRSSVGRAEIMRFSSQVGTPGIGQPLSSLKQFRVPCPPLSEQRAIAHILGSLDDKIELNRRMSATLEAMARTLFKSWFVDFDPVRAKAEGRDPALPPHTAALFPDHLIETEDGHLPKGWRSGRLDEALSELEVGGRPKGGISGYASGVPSIGAESIVGLGIFDFSKTKYVPVGFFENMKKGHIKNMDIVLYKDGGRPGEFEPHLTMFGKGFPYRKCAINEHVYRLRADSTLGQCFLYFWLSSDLLMDEMRMRGTGVAIPGLNSTQVRSLTTLFPSPEVLQELALHDLQEATAATMAW